MHGTGLQDQPLELPTDRELARFDGFEIVEAADRSYLGVTAGLEVRLGRGVALGVEERVGIV
jgi:hypothetical protein